MWTSSSFILMHILRKRGIKYTVLLMAPAQWLMSVANGNLWTRNNYHMRAWRRHLVFLPSWPHKSSGGLYITTIYLSVNCNYCSLAQEKKNTDTWLQVIESIAGTVCVWGGCYRTAGHLENCITIGDLFWTEDVLRCVYIYTIKLE